ncbi:hypothetical protein LCGC14_1316140 [marine sediment metagenome]|uniref:Uncharacterized protein n=1 Tax=marine sediment metagenome TaxID=412755 RepID=A0A0F9N1U3_9ZZZZ
MKEPQNLKGARDALSKQLNEHVGSAYGILTGKGKSWHWHLIVWSDNKNIQFPSIFKGFRVVRYDSCSALGK